MKNLLVLAAALVASVGCSSMTINNDYDRQADFSQYKTYAWHDSETNVADTDPFAHERFLAAVDSQLAANGFSKARPSRTSRGPHGAARLPRCRYLRREG